MLTMLTILAAVPLTRVAVCLDLFVDGSRLQAEILRFLPLLEETTQRIKVLSQATNLY